MNSPLRLARSLWISSLILFIAVVLVPVSNRMSRAGGLILLLIVWFGLIAMCWRRGALRISLIGITVLVAGRRIPSGSAVPNFVILSGAGKHGRSRRTSNSRGFLRGA